MTVLTATPPALPAPSATAPRAEPTWVRVCPYERLLPERGVCALVGHEQVAIFRLHDGQLHALSNHDPVARANVLSRGIVGTRGGTPTVVSPLYKQVYALDTGACLDQPGLRVPMWRVRVRDGAVEIAAPCSP